MPTYGGLQGYGTYGATPPPQIAALTSATPISPNQLAHQQQSAPAPQQQQGNGRVNNNPRNPRIASMPTSKAPSTTNSFVGTASLHDPAAAPVPAPAAAIPAAVVVTVCNAAPTPLPMPLIHEVDSNNGSQRTICGNAANNTSGTNSIGGVMPCTAQSISGLTAIANASVSSRGSAVIPLSAASSPHHHLSLPMPTAAAAATVVEDPIVAAYRAASEADRGFFTLDMLPGHVVPFATDPEGSRGLQRLISEASGLRTTLTRKGTVDMPTVKPPRVSIAPQNLSRLRLIFSEIEPRLQDVIFSTYGNFVVQKFIETQCCEFIVAVAAFCRGRAVSMAKDDFGCRILQNLVETQLMDGAAAVVAPHVVALISELSAPADEEIYSMIVNQNANHVLQRCMTFFPRETAFVVRSVAPRFTDLAKHVYGSRVIQCVFEQMRAPHVGPADEAAALAMMFEALRHFDVLVNTQYGNFAVTHALVNSPAEDACMAHLAPFAEWPTDAEKEQPTTQPTDAGQKKFRFPFPPTEIRRRIVDTILPNVVHLSSSKFASNVAQRVFQFSSETQQRTFMDVLLQPQSRAGTPKIVALMMDQYANYVMQDVFIHCADAQRQELLKCVRPYLQQVSRSQFGRHIVGKTVGAMAGITTGGRGGGNNGHGNNNHHGGHHHQQQHQQAGVPRSGPPAGFVSHHSGHITSANGVLPHHTPSPAYAQQQPQPMPPQQHSPLYGMPPQHYAQPPTMLPFPGYPSPQHQQQQYAPQQAYGATPQYSAAPPMAYGAPQQSMVPPAYGLTHAQPQPQYGAAPFAGAHPSLFAPPQHVAPHHHQMPPQQFYGAPLPHQQQQFTPVIQQQQLPAPLPPKTAEAGGWAPNAANTNSAAPSAEMQSLLDSLMASLDPRQQTAMLQHLTATASASAAAAGGSPNGQLTPPKSHAAPNQLHASTTALLNTAIHSSPQQAASPSGSTGSNNGYPTPHNNTTNGYANAASIIGSTAW